MTTIITSALSNFWSTYSSTYGGWIIGVGSLALIISYPVLLLLISPLVAILSVPLLITYTILAIIGVTGYWDADLIFDLLFTIPTFGLNFLYDNMISWNSKWV